MFNKSLRLSKDNDFKRVFSEGRQIKGSFLSFRVLENDLTFNRYGVLVGIKINSLAVKRNLIKRKIKNVLSKEDQKIKQGHDIVITTFPLILAKKYKEIESDIKNCLNKLKLYA